MEFSRIMSSTPGRSVRILMGLAFVIVGLVARGGWYALAVVGLVPILAGVMNVCFLAPFVGGHLSAHRNGV